MTLASTIASQMARPSTGLLAHRPAELVAKFMDNELRSGKDKKSDDMLEQTLDKALMLFRYISVRLLRAQEDITTCTALAGMHPYNKQIAAITRVGSELCIQVCGVSFTPKEA